MTFEDDELGKCTVTQGVVINSWRALEYSYDKGRGETDIETSTVAEVRGWVSEN